MKEELRRALWPNGPRADVWAIVDAAQDQRVYWTLTNSFLQHSCLFAGRLPEALEMAAPYLVQLDPEDKFTTYLAENMGQSLGVFLRCDTTLQELRRHLRSFLTVKDPSGRKMLFRYYDPRVLRIYLPTCSPGELQTVFGPVKAFWAETNDATELTQFEVKGRVLQVTAQQLASGTVATGGDELAPDIVPAQEVLVVQRGTGMRHRVPVLLQGAGGGGKLRRSAPNIRFYRTAMAPEELAFAGGAFTIPPSQLEPDVTVYAEAADPGEVALTLELSGGGTAAKTLTAVALRMDSGDGDVCVGVRGGRRRIDVLPVEPVGFQARLTLRTPPGGPALTLYTSETSLTGFPLAEGFRFDAPQQAESFWMDAETPSTRQGDALLQLTVEGGGPLGDAREITAAVVEPITTTVPTTPSKAARLPVENPLQTTVTGRMVFLTGATEAANPISLRAETQPAGMALRWTVARDSDDGEAIRALSRNPVPMLTPTDSGAALNGGAAGTFRIRATAGGGEEWGGPRTEMRAVFVHAALAANSSSVNGRFCACGRVAGTDLFRLHSGKDPAVRLEAEVKLTGGGADGRDGLEAIHGGWMSNIVSDNTGARYKGGKTATKSYVYSVNGAEAVVDFDAGPLLEAPPTSRCLPGSDSAANGEAKLAIRAQMAPATEWRVQDGNALDRTIEQIWRYLDCQVYLTLWSGDAPGQLGVLLQTGWSFTGDYTCNPLKTIRTVVPARLAATRTVAFPALVPAASTELEAHPPLSGRSNVEES